MIGRMSAAQVDAFVRHGVSYENHVDLPRAAVVEQYERCDLLAFASVYEGFGLPIVEAQAVGRPVVTSDLWSMPEVAGGAACLVDPGAVRSDGAVAARSGAQRGARRAQGESAGRSGRWTGSRCRGFRPAGPWADGWRLPRGCATRCGGVQAGPTSCTTTGSG